MFHLLHQLQIDRNSERRIWSEKHSVQLYYLTSTVGRYGRRLEGFQPGFRHPEHGEGSQWTRSFADVATQDDGESEHESHLQLVDGKNYGFTLAEIGKPSRADTASRFSSLPA